MTGSRRVSRQVERDLGDDNIDFASAGPWELLVIVQLALVYAYLYVAIPHLTVQIYGAAPATSYRPVITCIALGFISAMRPARRESSKPVILLAIASTWYGLAIKYATEYFRWDAHYIDVGLEYVRAFAAHGQERGYDKYFDFVPLLETSTPVVASALVDLVFFVPLTMVMVGLIKQRARKTQLPSVISMSAFLVAGPIVCKLLQRSEMVKASHLVWLAPATALLALTSSRSVKALSCSLVCCIILWWTYQGTPTLACSRLPHILQCRDVIGGFRVLDNRESLSGRITILENDKYRLMKADHSLLGGEWVGQGNGQSIFAAFYMQAQAIHAFLPPRKDFNVLQIGLGIGTATKTMLEFADTNLKAMTLSIDLVELDPAVVHHAHTYFGLPRPAQDTRIKVHVQDAVEYIRNVPDMSYDIISHDVFTGGSLAYPLFTRQFFLGLQKRLKPGGILTVNFVYAPDVAELNLVAVTSTLKSVFAYVDAYLEKGEVGKINNMVFFASDSAMKLEVPRLQRKAQNTLEQTATSMKDWKFDLGNVQVNESLVLQDEEIDYGVSRRLIRHGEMQMALTHWRLMRDLLPPPESDIWTTV